MQRLIKQAINDSHLGENQQALYPTLASHINDENVNDIANSISKLTKEYENLQMEIQKVQFSERESLLKFSGCLKIEISCLSLLVLDETVTLPTIRKQIKSLLKLIPEGLEFERDVNDILAFLDPSQSSSSKAVSIEDTDAWEDLFLIGTEVKNSCQRINGDPHLNKALLAYLNDGKNKAIIVRDDEGKILARVFLRILLDDNNQPVLFMERLYTRYEDSNLEKHILKGCINKAKIMRMPLLGSKTWSKKVLEISVWPHKLHSFGGPASFEYVDELGGIHNNGKFSIDKSWLIYRGQA